VITAIAFYAVWTARRLDRMHTRLDAAGAALDGQLRARADAAASFATGHAQLARAAAAAQAVEGLGHDREVAENALSRALEQISGEPDSALVDVTTRTNFAHRFHNDAVRDALGLRKRRIVRYLRLAGHAPLPTFFEMDDTTLERRTIGV
jgi:hypothetical protein